MDHGGVGDDGEVAAFADDICFADGDDVVIGGDFAFDAAIEIFVLEENAGIVVADGGFDEAFGVVGRGGANDFEAGIVDEPHLGILRVEGAAVDVSAAGAAQDERSGRAPEVVRFCNHVGDLVEGAADEIHELEFGDGTHAGERGSEGCADDGGFRDGSVDDTLGAEAVDESVGDFEGAAVDADVFAEAKDGRVAVHFFPDSLADGFEVGEEHRGELKCYQRFNWVCCPNTGVESGTEVFSTLTSIPQDIKVHRTRCLRVPPREDCPERALL